jgi:hypothetical protein
MSILALALGCVSGFKQFYVDQLGPNKGQVVISSGVPEVYSGRDPQQDSLTMVERGFVLAGTSNFNGPAASLEQARAQGQAVHAAVVMLYSRFTNTVTGTIYGTVPNPDQVVTTRQQGTVYGPGGTASYSGTSTTTIPGGYSVYTIPYTTARYDQMALFWMRAKPPIFGVFTRDLTSEERTKFLQKRGVIVTAVIQQSPAFEAAILHDDLLLTIGSDDLADAATFVSVVQKHAGQEVDVEFLRSGERHTVRVKLNERAQ